MKQSKIVLDQEIKWKIDINVVAKVQKWVAKFPEKFKQEVKEMEQFFPRWILTIAKGTEIVVCPECNNSIVPKEGNLACICCDFVLKKKEGFSLAWTGHLPVLVSGRNKFINSLEANYDRSIPLIELKGNWYWLASVLLIYPNNFPTSEISCYYTKNVLKAIGYPNAGSFYHLFADGRMCLFSYNEWDGITAREVLQQRVVNHLISTIKIADGVPATKAFIGREHGYYDR